MRAERVLESATRLSESRITDDEGQAMLLTEVPPEFAYHHHLGAARTDNGKPSGASGSPGGPGRGPTHDAPPALNEEEEIEARLRGLSRSASAAGIIRSMRKPGSDGSPPSAARHSPPLGAARFPGSLPASFSDLGPSDDVAPVHSGGLSVLSSLSASSSAAAAAAAAAPGTSGASTERGGSPFSRAQSPCIHDQSSHPHELPTGTASHGGVVSTLQHHPHNRPTLQQQQAQRAREQQHQLTGHFLSRILTGRSSPGGGGRSPHTIAGVSLARLSDAGAGVTLGDRLSMRMQTIPDPRHPEERPEDYAER